MSNIPVRSQTPIANPPKSSASEKVDGLLADDVAVELAKSTLAAVLKFIEEQIERSAMEEERPVHQQSCIGICWRSTQRPVHSQN